MEEALAMVEEEWAVVKKGPIIIEEYPTMMGMNS